MNQQAPVPRVDQAPDRASMAKANTQLALDRTTLAWVRTTLTMGTFGFGTIAFFRAMTEKAATPEAIRLHHGAVRFGMSLVLLGVVATVLAAISHWRYADFGGMNLP
jgi:putative membrane protein